MQLTANESEACLVGGQLKKKKEKDVCIKYKDRHISCTYILDNKHNTFL